MYDANRNTCRESFYLLSVANRWASYINMFGGFGLFRTGRPNIIPDNLIRSSAISYYISIEMSSEEAGVKVGRSE